MDLEKLNQLVENHSPLISAGTLAEKMAAVPEALRVTLQYEFLNAVLHYNAQHQAKNPDWEASSEWFMSLQNDSEATPLLAFYIPNYLLLSRRNAGGDIEVLEPIFQQAQAAAGQLDGPDQYRLLGFLLYNWSRCLHKAGRTDEALTFYNQAGTQRVLFYEHAKQSGLDEDVIKGAATQAWKIRHDWSTFFPNADIGQCDVTEQTYEEVGKLANPNFSAASAVKGATVIVGLVLFLLLGDPLARYFQVHAPARNDNSGEFFSRWAA